jgi:hypothetical protein
MNHVSIPGRNKEFLYQSVQAGGGAIQPPIKWVLDAASQCVNTFSWNKELRLHFYLP